MYATLADVADMATTDLSDSESVRVDGLIRRAERSLAALLLGSGLSVEGLAVFDEKAVVDVVVDAVLRRMDNPSGYASETDGDYSYRYEKGTDGFWWPADWRALFGLVPMSTNRAATIPVGISCGWRGWAG